jgi:hypothetical protein
VETLERLWAAQQAAGRRAALRAYAWETGRVRPENAPVRRVVALAHLAARWAEVELPAAACAALGATPAAANRTLAGLVALPAPPGYWAQHWDFGIPVRSPKS